MFGNTLYWNFYFENREKFDYKVGGHAIYRKTGEKYKLELEPTEFSSKAMRKRAIYNINFAFDGRSGTPQIVAKVGGIVIVGIAEYTFSIFTKLLLIGPIIPPNDPNNMLYISPYF